MKVIATLEEALGRELHKEYEGMQPGDVPATYADIDDLSRDTGFEPKTDIADGIAQFARWYKEFWVPMTMS